MTMRPEAAERWVANVQGNILAGYPRAHAARLLLCQVVEPSAARETLRRLLPAMTFHEQARDGQRCRLNVGFTYRGLRALGLNATELSGFDANDPFRGSMQRRKRELGDLREEDDRDAHWGSQPLDFVLLLHLDEARVDGLRALLLAEGARARTLGTRWSSEPGAELRAALAASLDEAAAELGTLAGVQVRAIDLHHPLAQDYGIEYFGFRDGVRNPEPLRERDECPSAVPDHPAREFVLVCPDDPLRDGGSFLVLRQLEQNIERFWGEVDEQAKAAGLAPLELAEQLMGRRQSGAPLDDALAGDVHGPAFTPGSGASRCPFASHVRRVNPQIDAERGSNPRIIRRGLSYLDPGGSRGLMFLAFNADPEAQFEFMQKNWVQRGNSAGARSDDFDVIAGCPIDHDRRTSFRLAPDQHRAELSFTPFVQFVEGEYAFVPSRAALGYIAAEPAARAGLLRDPVEELLSTREKRLTASQKELLQLWLDHPGWSRRFWNGVRAKAQRDGEKAVRLGEYEFVAEPEEVERVLLNKKRIYSMKEYGRRFAPATGEFFLGMDEHSPRYLRERPTAAFLDEIPQAKVARTAEQAVLATLLSAERRYDPTELPKRPLAVSLRELLASVLAAVCEEHFAVPGPSLSSFASWGKDLAFFFFRLFPDEVDEARARDASQQYRSHVLALYTAAKHAAKPSKEQRKLRDIGQQIEKVLAGSRPRGTDVSDDDVARNLLGIITGSLGATMKLFTEGLLIHLAGTGDGTIHFPDTSKSLYESVLRPALQAGQRGGPDSLYRVRRDGDKEVFTVVWLGGAQELDPDILFGKGAHRCPGMHIGKGMLEGILRALAQRKGAFRGSPEQLRFEFNPA